MPNEPPRKHGTGAAHIGFSMFGARGPVLAPEDAGASGGTGQQQQPAAPPQPTPAPAPTITPEIQALIDAAVTTAKNAAFADARRTFEGKQKPKSEPKQEPPNADDASSLLALRDGFDDATAELKLTKGQRQLLREAVMTKRPSEVDGFVTDYVTRAGWITEPVKEPATVALAPKPPAAARPLSDLGSPAGTPAERASDVTKWTSEDVERYYQSKGGTVRRGADGSLDFNLATNSKIHRELREMARQKLANVRVLLGPRRP